MSMRLVVTLPASGFQLPEDPTKPFGDAVTPKSVSYKYMHYNVQPLRTI